MENSVRVLILEDRLTDAELMVDALMAAGLDPVWERVDTEEDYLAHLSLAPDLILADYNLPQFDGLQALKLLTERALDIPFIIVSGTLGEEMAVRAMQAGAADYLHKDRLARLGQAAVHALAQKKLRDEKQRVEQELRKNQHRFRALIEHAADAIALLGPDGKLEYVSPSTERILGFTADEMIGRNPAEFTHPDDLPFLLEQLADLFRYAGKTITLRYRFLHQDGSWRWLESTITNQLTEPDINAVVFNYRDITTRQEAEEQIHSQARLIENVSDAIIAIDRDALIQSWNHAAEIIYGWHAEEVVGKQHITILETDQTPTEYADAFKTLMASGVWHGEVTQKHKHGMPVHILASVSLIRDEQHNYRGSVAVNRDITARKHAEQALLASQERFRRFFELGLIGMAITSPSKGNLEVNDELCKILGYERSELMAMNWMELTYPDDLAKDVALFDRVMAGEIDSYSIEKRWLRKDGGVIYATIAVKCVRSADGTVDYFVALLQDITQRRLAEREIQRRADEFAALYEIANELARQTDLGGLLDTVIQRAMTLLHASSGTLLFYDAASGDLEVVVTKGSSLRVGTRINMGLGIAGIVATTHEPMIVNDYPNWTGPRAQATDSRMQASVQVPMLNQGELIGVLAVNSLDAGHTFSHGDMNLLSLFASQAAAAVHNTRLLVQTQARASQLGALYDAGLALNSVLEPGVQLEFLFKIATRALHADRAEFFRYDPQSDELRFELGIGHSSETRARLMARVLPGSDDGEIAGWVTKHRVPLSVPELAADTRWRGSTDVALHAGIWVPVEHENKLLGVLGVLSEQGNAFTPMDERLLVLFANQAAVALQNARLFEEATRRTAQLATLNGIGRAISTLKNIDEVLQEIYRQVQHSLLLDMFFVGLYDSETNLFNYRLLYDEGKRYYQEPDFVLDDTYLFQILNGEDPFLINRSAQEVATRSSRGRLANTSRASASLLFVPLQIGQRVVGVMSAQTYTLNAYREEHLDLLLGIASQATIAIENARLFEQTEQQVEYLGALRLIDMAISGSVELDIILDILLDQVVTKLKVDAACVLLLDPHQHSLDYVAGRGFRTKNIEHSHLRLGEDFAGRAALEGQMVVVAALADSEIEFTRARLLADEKFVAYYAVPLTTKGHITGVLEIFHRTPITTTPDWLKFLEALAGQAAIAIDNARLFQRIQRSNVELSLASDATIEGWSRALDLRESETEGHTQWVTELTLRLAREMQISENDLVHLRRGALLHDIGKMGIPDSILLKPGALTEQEWQVMRKHPQYAFDLLKNIPYLLPALDIPYAHHEKWDGSGYPRGLVGEQIPLAARIFAVVDVWDALCSDRPYRKAWTRERARAYLQAQSGIHFDPAVVKAFMTFEDLM